MPDAIAVIDVIVPEAVIDVIVPPPIVIDIASVGVQGPQGVPGPPGPAGPRTNIVEYKFSTALVAPPGTNQLRFNAAYPYTAVTKVWMRLETGQGQDVYWGLMLVEAGSALLVQDKNDHTVFGRFRTTAAPVDLGDYIEFSVAWTANGGAAIANNADVLAQSAAVLSHGGTIGIVFDGGGVVITPGLKGFFEVGVDCTVTAATLLSTDASATAGSLVVDVWKAPYAGYPPTVADSITASAQPTLSSANKSRDTTLAGWTTTITAGDILAFNVISAATVTKVAFTLTVQV